LYRVVNILIIMDQLCIYCEL